MFDVGNVFGFMVVRCLKGYGVDINGIDNISTRNVLGNASIVGHSNQELAGDSLFWLGNVRNLKIGRLRGETSRLERRKLKNWQRGN